MRKKERQASQTVSREAFARLVEDALRVAGETGRIRHDTENFRLIIGSGTTAFQMFLGNHYDEYVAAPVRRRAKLLERMARLTKPRPSPPETWADALPHLVPRVHRRLLHEPNELVENVNARKKADFPSRVLGEHFAVALGYDMPEMVMMVTGDMLDKWGVPFETALAAATANLERMSGRRFQKAAPGVWLSPWRDSHDATRVVLADMIAQLRIKGDPVAMIPNADTLIVTGSKDEEGLQSMAGAALKILEAPRSHSGVALILKDRHWEPYEPVTGHPAAPLFRFLRVRSIARDYAEQQIVLEARFKKKGTPIVSGLAARQDRKTQSIHTSCLWTEDQLPALLPAADEVLFTRKKDEKELEILAHARWGKVRALVGELMEPTPLWPPRWMVRSFPTAEQLGELGLLQPPERKRRKRKKKE